MSILLVDDDLSTRGVLEGWLHHWGYEVSLAKGPNEASEMARASDPDLVLSGIFEPGSSGLEFLGRLRGDRPARPILLLTRRGNVEMTVEAMKAGVVDVLTKPVNRSRLKAVLDRTLRGMKDTRGIRGKDERGHPEGFGPFIGTSARMLDTYALIRMLGDTDASILVTGETGTGKELAARAIHDLSARGAERFVALNTAAIPEDLVESELFGHEQGSFTGASGSREGCFEMADGGTLFLDEIAEMSTSLQPKLLRVLDEARFRRVGGRQELTTNVRIISATNRDPREAVEAGILREDLYHRLNVFPIHLPPLRERVGDIPLLARAFLERSRTRLGLEGASIQGECLALLEGYAWPGNVRELRNVMERAAILARSGEVTASHLPSHMRNGEDDASRRQKLPSGITAAELEKRLILQTLDETGNNKAEAARRLNLDVKTIRNKLNKYRG